MEPQESSELAANDGGSFRSFGCPFSNGNGFASSTRQTNGGGGAAAVAMNGNGIASSPSHNSAAAPDNYHIRLHVNASREIPKGGMLYGDYLQIDKLLSCQEPVTRMAGNEVHDEHLFIITHQAYELWFKQIIFEIDSVREIMTNRIRDEANLLIVTSRLNRVVLILKLLVDQVTILESMTPLDFMEFRDFLSPASGFQSVQFRLLENKLGVRNDLRTNYGKSNYLKIFEDQEVISIIKQSEDDFSLCDLLQQWLERTPGLEEEDFCFWEKYRGAVSSLLDDKKAEAESQADEAEKALQLSEWKRKQELFESVFDVKKHNALVARGDRRFSHKALQGALMISLYRDEPRFNQPFQILLLLMDIDSLITKWRSKWTEGRGRGEIVTHICLFQAF